MRFLVLRSTHALCKLSAAQCTMSLPALRKFEKLEDGDRVRPAKWKKKAVVN
jgi:hypothetical protein